MRRRRGEHRAESQPAAPWTRARMVSVGAFALMVVLGPLAFGAVDRLPQLGLLALLIVGILAQPPAVAPLSRWGNRLAIAFVALVLVAQFAPASWFGQTSWRLALTSAFALEMPWTHHPEPGRAVEALLAGIVGVIWFLWVRRLAAERDNRPVLAWALLVAAAVVAVVSFATQAPQSEAIFGLRYTPGWSGFGPFPNRNHTASFFAMAAVLGCGCLAWAGLWKRWMLFGAGTLLVGLIVIALLATASRGGLLAFAAGLGAFLALLVLKLRNRRALGAALGAVLVFAALALAFGAQVFARFHSREGGEVSTLTRVGVWKDAAGMWLDAPLLGHGLGAFASIFPLYQKIELENQIAIHPESSWLQWLVELGALPVLLAAACSVLFLGRHLRESFSRNRSFFLRAGGFAAGATLLVHALFDVPAHRWGTAAFALAALAIACPMRLAGRRIEEPRKTALVPAAVALVWLLPFLADVPRWSPTSLTRLLSRQAVPPGVPLAELDASRRWFPLNADLHQLTGLRLLGLHGRDSTAEWRRHFAIAARLVPGSWYLTSAQARAVQRLSPMMALPYWQESVTRGGIHREEVLGDAWRDTSRSPAARAAWGRYVEAHPRMLLAYARLVPDTHASYYYSRWWKQRGGESDLGPEEIGGFHSLAAKWGDRAQLDDWMTRHAAWENRDFRAWAALLHAWGDDARAWQLLATHVPEPAFPAKAPNIPRPQLESTWRTTPQNLVNAQQLAHVRDLAGDAAGRDAILLTVVAQENAPPWFIQKAAHLLARDGRTREAVATLLRQRR